MAEIIFVKNGMKKRLKFNKEYFKLEGNNYVVGVEDGEDLIKHYIPITDVVDIKNDQEMKSSKRNLNSINPINDLTGY